MTEDLNDGLESMGEAVKDLIKLLKQQLKWLIGEL